MLKNQRVIISTTATALILALISSMAVYAKDNANSCSLNDVTIETASDTVQGEVRVQGTNETDEDIKIMVQKDELVAKWYDVDDQRYFDKTIELNDGEGYYNIYAMIHIEGNRYAYGPVISVQNTEDTKREVVATSSEVVGREDINNEVINNEDITIEDLSQKLTAGKNTSFEKIEAIHNWVAENISYDYEKYSHMQAKDYSDEFGAEAAFESKKGVCYDMAKLFEELCKDSGIEAKCDAGYSTNIRGYHAWNEVYDEDSGEWLIIDLTLDSLHCHKTGDRAEMIVREASDYSKTSEM